MRGDNLREMELKLHIGQRLKIARKRAGLTQADLAERMQKSVETLSNLERGNALTSLETLGQLASSLNVPLEFFVSGYSTTDGVSSKREAALARMQLEIYALDEKEVELALRLVSAIRE